MAADPHLDRVERLGPVLWRTVAPDGRTLLIRPLRRSDAPALQRAFLREDREDRRLRLLTDLPRLPLPFAERLCDCDPGRDVCLVYVAENPPPELEGELLGGARVMRDAPGSDRAEFALSMSSELKGRGLGLRIFLVALMRAREIGIRRVWAVYARENRAMRTLAERVGLAQRADPDDPALVLGEGELDGLRLDALEAEARRRSRRAALEGRRLADTPARG